MCFVLIEPNAPPANVQGHNTSSTSIWVHWDAVPIADQNGIILTYTVTYSSLPGGISQTAIINASSTHVTLKGLKKYTNYSIFVFASTAKGDGNASDPITVTTDEDSKLLKALRASFCKYRESGYSFKIFTFFIHILPNKAFSELFSKIQFKDPKALEFFQNRGNFENRHFGLPPPLKIDKNDAFSFRSCW